MSKELMWACAILPKEVNHQLVTICKEENKGIGLPENVFRFPMHISMKKSFQTTEFDAVKADIVQHIQAHGQIRCCTGRVISHKKMLWLPVEATGDIKTWHDELDKRLLGKYAIPIDRFDVVFQPHISLFTKGDPAQLKNMQARLSERVQPLELTLNRFVIGSSGHKDEYFEI